MAQNGLLDFLQGASNSAASTVSAPVDGLAWLLRKAGAKVGDNPIGGSDWMRANGLTQEPQNKLMGLLGEAAGGVAPMVAGAYAPQIAKGLLGMADNAMAPRTMNKQAGVIGYHGTMTPNFDKFNLDSFGKTDDGWLGKGIYAAKSPTDASAYAMVNGNPGGAVFKVDMDLKNPLNIDWEASNKSELLAKRRLLGPDGFTSWLKQSGHDGVVFQGPKNALNSAGERDIQYMAINPQMVKQINY